MKYKLKNMKAIRYYTLLTYCIVFIISELNNHDVDLENSALKQVFASNALDLLSQKKENNVGAIVQDTLSEDVTGDISLGTISLTSGKLSYQQGIFPGMLFRYNPFVLFVILIIRFSQCYVNRMYLIHFIHDSDGEKGQNEFLNAYGN